MSESRDLKTLPKFDVMPSVPMHAEHGLTALIERGRPATVRYTRTESWEIVGGLPATFTNQRNRRLTIIALGAAVTLVLSAITAIVTLWLTMRQPQAPKPRQPAVSIALAAPRPVAATTAQPAPVPAAATPAVAAVMIPAAPLAQSTPTTPEAALEQAFATNEAWTWEGMASRGVVVVGPATIENGQPCRDVSILTRGAGPDRTLNNRRCETASGAIVESPPAGKKQASAKVD